MAADFGFVVHAAQGNANELAAQGAGDGLAQRGLAHSRRSDETEDGPLQVALQLEDGQVFEHALLDFFQVVVVFIQDLLGALDVHLLRARLRPRQGRQPFQVGAGDGVLSGGNGNASQALQLALSLLLHLFGQAGIVNFLL